MEVPTLSQAVKAGASRHPDKPALIVEEQRWSYAELDAAIDRLAAGLVAFGIKVGDRVALHFTNGFEAVVTYQACFRTGAIAVPLNTRMKGPELQYVLNHSGARLYLGQPGLFAEIDPVRSGVQAVESYFLSGDIPGASGVSRLADLSGASSAIEPRRLLASAIIRAPAASTRKGPSQRRYVSLPKLGFSSTNWP